MTQAIQASQVNHVRIGERFAGPPQTGNGGYTCGVLASLPPGQRGPTTVTLRRPPPLNRPMDLRASAASGLDLFAGDVLIAQARPAPNAVLDLVDPVDFPTASAAGATFAGLTRHPFPGCFVCGVDRPAGDGLNLRPGRLPDRADTTACAWHPDASLPRHGDVIAPEIVWASLDCPGGWTLPSVGRPAVLGRLTATVDAQPQVGEPCVVMGRLLRQAGRKSVAATTLYDSDGRILARAEAVWIELPTASLPGKEAGKEASMDEPLSASSEEGRLD
jgi:hypothetical protein